MGDEETTESEDRKEKDAAEAAERIKRGQHWLDWMYIAAGLEVGRVKAMRRAGTNRPMGSAYNRAFGDWLNERSWARDLDKPTRNHLFWCADNRNNIEAWRETLAPNERARLNHPTALKRRYEATQNPDEANAGGKGVKETRAQKLEREIERLTNENDDLKRTLRRAKDDGSLFDLRNDSVANIARVIADTMASGRLQSLQQKLAEEIKRARAKPAHAG